MRGKWAQGIVPRGFCWIIKDQIAVCERPGGFGSNHRRIRRQEEIIWIRENNFDLVISLLPTEHNLHNYDEHGVVALHRPFNGAADGRAAVVALCKELHDLVQAGKRVVVHRNELGDQVTGLMAAYLLWSGLVNTGPRSITVTEQLVQRQLGPSGREIVAELDSDPGG